MASWYRLDLGNGQDAYGPTQRVMQAFMATMIGVGPGSGRAVFSRYDLQADNVELFFTPEASDLAKSMGAVACEKPAPTRDRLGLVVGEDGELGRRFPAQARN